MEIYCKRPEVERARQALEQIKPYETFIEYIAYEVGHNYLPKKVEYEKELTLEEREGLDPRELEGIMITPPEYEQFEIAPGIFNKCWTKKPRAIVKLFEFSPTLAKIRFNHFMNDSQVRGVFPEMKWTVRGFHDFVRINLNNYPSSVMALRKLDPEKIIGFEVEEIPPRYGENHRMKVDVFTKEEA